MSRAETSTDPLIELRGLRKGYRTPDGDVQAVLDVPEWTVAVGEGGAPREIALRGRSGSGKTTLLNVLAGLLAPDAGTVRVLGRDLTSLSESGRDRFRAQNVGYVFQTFNLLDGFSALENVVLGMSFGPGPDERRAQALLESLDMGDRLHHRPRQLSIGQRQRVALARALANRPRIVLADEPTGNLDAANARAALAAIRSTCRGNGASLLLVSHDEAVLAEFDEVLTLGEINRAAGTGGAAT